MERLASIIPPGVGKVLLNQEGAIGFEDALEIDLRDACAISRKKNRLDRFKG